MSFPLNLRGKARRGFNPRSALWPLGTEAGMWLDPSDAATGYQNSTGATAGVVDSPTGLRLDKRQGIARGAELAPQTSITTGWTATNATLSSDGTLLTLTNSAGAQSFADASFVTVVGQWYEFTGVCTGGTGALIQFRLGSSGPGASEYAQFLGVASNQLIFKATSTTTYVRLFGGSSVGETGIYGPISTKALGGAAGNHVLQATAAARPLWKLNSSIYSDLDDAIDDGYSTAVVAAGGIGNADMTMLITMQRNSAANMVIASENPADVGQIIGRMESGSGSSAMTGVGTGWSVFVNGVAVGGVNSCTRDQLHTAVGSGSYKVVEFRNLDLSAWTQLTFGLYTAYMLGSNRAQVLSFPSNSAQLAATRTFAGAKGGLSL